MSTAIFPYMASRGTYPLDKNTLYGPTMAEFPYNGTITFRWGELAAVDPSIPAPKSFFLLTAMGNWGGSYVRHAPILMICTTLPTPTVTYQSEALMQADIQNQPYETNTTFDTTNAAIAAVGSELWICQVNGTGRVWLPLRQKIADGQATIGNNLCNIYYCDVDVADIPEIDGNPMDADEVFDLCWVINGRHAEYGYDAAFRLTPVGSKLQDKIIERIELNARVAGQRAIKKDEMLTRSQLEAGSGVELVYREADGTAAGYSQETDRGYNVIIQSNAGQQRVLTRQWEAPPQFVNENYLLWSWGEQIVNYLTPYNGRFIKWQVGPYGISYIGQPTTTVGVTTAVLEVGNSFAQQFAFGDWHTDRVIIDPVTQQPTSGDARSIEILESGYYRVHSLIDGYLWIKDVAQGWVFNAHLALRLYWKKDASAGYSHILDRWQYNGMFPPLFPPPEQGVGDLTYWEDNGLWILSGDMTMYLEAGTRLWSGLTGFSREPSDYQWAVIPTYHYFELEYLGNRPATTNQYPNRVPTNQILARA